MPGFESLRALVSPEVKLTALLSRPKLTASQVSCCLLLIELVSFENLKKQIDFHRVWACAYCNIRDHFSEDFPISLVDELYQRYQEQTHRSLLQFKATNQIERLFKENSISVKVIKGISLAQKLFGDIAKRYSNDIDILISKEQLELAHNLLKELGFHNFQFEQFSEEKKDLYFRGCKDVSYVDRQGLVLELHTRLCVETSVFSQRIDGHMLNGQNNTSDPMEFLYYCKHGSSTLYHRLKWLLDIVLHIEEFERADMQAELLLEESKKFELDEVLVFSWVLAHLIYEIPLPRRIESHYNNSSVQKTLIKNTLLTLIQPKCSLGFRHRITTFYGALGLISSYEKKLLFVLQKLRPTDRDLYFFPKAHNKLLFLYYVFRPIRILFIGVPKI